MQGFCVGVCVVAIASTCALCCPRRAHSSLTMLAFADPTVRCAAVSVSVSRERGGAVRGAGSRAGRWRCTSFPLLLLRAAIPRPALRGGRGAGGAGGTVAGAAARGDAAEDHEAQAASLEQDLKKLQGELAPLVGEKRDDAPDTRPGERAALQQRVGDLAQTAITLFRAQLQLARRERQRQRGGGGTRGLLILFEGLDRSGKGTQVQMLAASLEAAGRNVSRIGFPRRDTSTGRMLDNYLRAKGQGFDLDARTLHMLFAANRWECAEDIYRRLHQGQDVVVDRYAFSGIAYSVAKGLEGGWCRQWEQGLPAPDVIFLLDILPEVAAQRPGYGDERYERVEFQTRVRSAYLALVREARLDAAAAAGGAAGGGGEGAGGRGGAGGRREQDQEESSPGKRGAGGREGEGGAGGEEAGGEGKACEDGGSWVVMNASGSVEEVAARVVSTVHEVRTRLLSSPEAGAGARGRGGGGVGDNASESRGICCEVLEV